MKKILSIILTVFFIFEGTSSAFAYVYNPNGTNSGSIYKNSNNTSVYRHRPTAVPSRNWQYDRRSSGSRSYASSAGYQHNPYPKRIQDAEILAVIQEIRGRNSKAPTGNYPRRAYMPNK